MALKPELFALGKREFAQKKGVIALLFHRLNPVVMRSIHEDRFKEEAVFAPRLEIQEASETETLRLFAQGMLSDVWTSPGGAMEVGEAPEETVLRELREEVLMSVQDHRPKDVRLANSILSAKLQAKPMPEIPVPVVVQTNKKNELEQPQLRGVFEVFTTKIDLSDDEFYPLCGAGIFRYMVDVHITESLRPTLKYLLHAYQMVEAEKVNGKKKRSHV